MQTIQDFIKAHGITVTFRQVYDRPSIDEWDANARHYRATVRANGSRYTTWYSQGSGIKDDPDATSLLDCLGMDAGLGENSFEDFCSELGYDEDSRKAHKQWLACHRSREALVRLLGEETLNQLVYDTERL